MPTGFDAYSTTVALAAWSSIVESIDTLGAEEFLFRSPAYASDVERGRSILWLICNDGWKRRVTERLSIPRTDTIETLIEFDVDVAQIRRHRLPPEASGSYWLPLMASSPTVPSVMTVTDRSGSLVTRLTSSEIRWSIAAGLASLAVRLEPELSRDGHRRDVELLLAASIRRHLEMSATTGQADSEPDGADGPDRVPAMDDQSRKRTDSRIAVARSLIESCPTRAVVRAAELVAVLAQHRLLVVEASSHDSSHIFRCELPSRPLEVILPQSVEERASPEPGTALSNPRGLRGRVPIARRKMYERTRQEGPASGRTFLEVQLLAYSSGKNYHVQLDLPEGTQAFQPRVVVEWDVQEVERDWRDQARNVSAFARELRSSGATEAASSRSPQRARLQRSLRSLDAITREAERNIRVVRSGANRRESGTPTSLDGRIACAREVLEVTDRGAWSDDWSSVDLDDLVDALDVVSTDLERVVETQEWPARVESHPDLVHIAVPASDAVTRRVPTVGAHLALGLYLSDPRPHTPTNLVNVLNAFMIGVVGVCLLFVEWRTSLRANAELTVEMSAIVTILVLFVAIQAYRLQLPGRTWLRGWLGRLPYLLGLLSPLPAVLLGIWTAAGGLRLWTGGAGVACLVVSLIVVGSLQVSLVTVGIHAGREASFWDPMEARRRVLTPPMQILLIPTKLAHRVWRVCLRLLGRRVQKRLATGNPPDLPPVSDYLHSLERVAPPDLHPQERLLGRIIRSVPLGSLWFVPSLRTSDSDRPAVDLPRLLSSEMQDLLNEAAGQALVTDPQHSIAVWMHDRPGQLMEVAELIQGNDGSPPTDISVTLGASFAGYAVMQMLVADPSGTRLKKLRSHQLAPNAKWRATIADRPVERDGLAVLAPRDVVEFLVAGPLVELPRDLRRLAGLAAQHGLAFMLCHLPTAPPPDAASSELAWLRVRLGIPHRSESALDVVVEQFVRSLRGRECRINSVSEFARPSGGLAPHDELLRYADLTSGATDKVTMIVAQMRSEHAIVHELLDLVRRNSWTMTKPGGRAWTDLSGCSIASGLGRCFAILYFEEQLIRESSDRIRSHLEDVPHDGSSLGDRSSSLTVWDLEAWPDPARRQLYPVDVSYPALRLTWNAPNAPGVFLELMRVLDDETRFNPNLSYVLSRVKDMNSYVGRFVVRLEPNGSAQPTAEFAEDLARRTTRRLQDHVDRQAEAGVERREVFVTIDLFSQTTRP